MITIIMFLGAIAFFAAIMFSLAVGNDLRLDLCGIDFNDYGQLP